MYLTTSLNEEGRMMLTTVILEVSEKGNVQKHCILIDKVIYDENTG